YEEVIRIFRKHCGPEHSEVAVNMHNLGSLLSRMGRLEEARCICKEALQLKEARLGLEHLDLATTLNSLGWIAEELQDWRAALSAYRRASDLFTRHLGKEHPRTQICQSNLDRCLSAQSGRRS
ncbi:MAG: tetratricopeptide repeat protein, partial [Planctomycetaceae bacterium]|nr:tetratricopeptide repeat protein [Planctomycetaceae bacterium]